MSENFEGDSPTYLAAEIARMNTHYDGCWLNGPRHWQCAVAEANRQRERAEAAEAALEKAYGGNARLIGENNGLDAQLVAAMQRAEAAETLLFAAPMDEICAVIAGFAVGDGGHAKRVVREWLDRRIKWLGEQDEVQS